MNNNRVLIFDYSLKGHRIEYFHHLYCEAVNNTHTEYVFLYPKVDQEQFNLLSWPLSSRIKLCGFVDDGLNDKNYIFQAFGLTRILKKAIKENDPSSVIIMDAFACLPFVAFIRGIHIKTIVGGIYLYTWKKDGFIKNLLDVLKYEFFARFKVFDTVYIQSDKPAAKWLNKLYNTNKFDYICDPVPRLSVEVRDLRSELNIPNDKTVVLHPGDLSIRKGTIELLQGINALEKQVLSSYCFILAGRVRDTIKDKFYSLIESIKEKGGYVLFIEGFVDFDYLASLVYTSDILFLPYSLTNQSSGIVGYGAEYKKPVVVTKDGLLGKIVKRYHLGYVLKDSSTNSISSFLSNKNFNWTYRDNSYLESNTISEFAKSLLCK